MFEGKNKILVSLNISTGIPASRVFFIVAIIIKKISRLMYEKCIKTKIESWCQFKTLLIRLIYSSLYY